MNHKLLTLPLLTLMGSFVMGEDKSQSLFDFTGNEASKEWQPVNDGVMGGVSEGKFRGDTTMNSIPSPRMPPSLRS